MTSICCEVPYFSQIFTKWTQGFQVRRTKTLCALKPALGRPSLALGLLAAHAVLTLQLEGGGLLASCHRTAREVLKGLGGSAAVGEGILLEAVLIHVRVCAGVLLDRVHSLGLQFGSRGYGRHRGGLQGLWAPGGLGRRKGLDDANRGRVHAA